MITRVKPFKKEFNSNNRNNHFFHEGFDSKTYRNVNTYLTK